MKLKPTWLLVALSTFVIGVAMVLAWLYFPRSPGVSSPVISNAPEAPFVVFCDFVRNVNAYNQKVIRTKAILSVGTDTRTLWSSECDGKDFRISTDCFYPPDKDCGQVFTAIDKFRGGEKNGWLYNHTEIEVIGQYHSDEDSGAGHFEMLEVTGARALGKSVR